MNKSEKFAYIVGIICESAMVNIKEDVEKIEKRIREIDLILEENTGK